MPFLVVEWILKSNLTPIFYIKDRFETAWITHMPHIFCVSYFTNSSLHAFFVEIWSTFDWMYFKIIEAISFSEAAFVG